MLAIDQLAARKVSFDQLVRRIFCESRDSRFANPTCLCCNIGFKKLRKREVERRGKKEENNKGGNDG